MIVVDASAALEGLLAAPSAPAIWGRIFAPGETLHAPHLIDIEITQVLRRHAIAGRLSADACETALNDWAGITLVRYSHDFLVPRVWDLRANLSAYDAVYIALAEQLGAPLLTHDRKLASAPGHDAIVEFV